MSRVDVLDHGYVELVDSMGSDEDIIRAARMSTQKGFLGWGPYEQPCVCKKTRGEKKQEDVDRGYAQMTPCDTTGQPCIYPSKHGDEKLLRFLWENGHSTPFEFCVATFEVQLPIFVVREWHRHRTQGYSEASARYSPLEATDFMPTLERCVPNGAQLNKQVSSLNSNTPMPADVLAWLHQQQRLYAAFEDHNQQGLRIGIPKEIARIGMPVGRYTKMRATANLLNWTKFLRLRQGANAQLEIREYANAVAGLLAERFPRTMALFEESKGDR